jgi:hypothetical protein
MIDLKKYGYASRSAFLRDESPADLVFAEMAVSGDWAIEKSVLLHPKCPIEIRDTFAKDPIWYKRLVAFFATKGPEGYWKKAEGDPSIHIRAAFKRAFDWEVLSPEEKDAEMKRRIDEHNAMMQRVAQRVGA